jgi:hypothetical protein
VKQNVTSAGVSGVERLERRALLSAIPVGPELHVNAFTSGFQADAAVAVDADGDAVVTWYSYGQDGDGRGIYARLYDASGAPVGDEFLVNTHTSAYQTNPAVATDADGDFVIVWQSQGQDGSGYGVYAQRFNAAGVAQGAEFRVNQSTTGDQQAPAVAMDGDGDFVVVWEDGTTPTDTTTTNIFARRFDAAGAALGNEFRANSFTSAVQFAPAVAMNDAGAFVIAWGGNGPGDSRGTHARRFDNTGVALGPETTVNSFTTDEQYYPSVAMAESGDYVITWDSKEQDGSGWGVYGQRFSAAGTPLGGEFRVNTTTSLYQQNSSVAMDADGDFVVTWTGYADGVAGYGVYAQRYNNAGAAQGGEFLVNTFTPNVQQFPSAAMQANGDFFVAWESFGQGGSAFEVYAQRFAVAVSVTSSDFHFATAPHLLRFGFNGNVSASLGTDDLVVQNLTTGQTIPATDFTVAYSKATNVATFTYTGAGGALPDGNYRATLVASGISTPNGVGLGGDHVFDFFFLRGDANRDARVNLRDFNILAANFGEVNRDFTQGDFNYDNVVNLQDFNLLAARFGQVLAPATTAAAPGFGGTRVGGERDDDRDDLLG